MDPPLDDLYTPASRSYWTAILIGPLVSSGPNLKDTVEATVKATVPFSKVIIIYKYVLGKMDLSNFIVTVINLLFFKYFIVKPY